MLRFLVFPDRIEAWQEAPYRIRMGVYTRTPARPALGHRAFMAIHIGTVLGGAESLPVEVVVGAERQTFRIVGATWHELQIAEKMSILGALVNESAAGLRGEPGRG